MHQSCFVLTRAKYQIIGDVKMENQQEEDLSFDHLKVGQTFESYDDVLSFVKKWGQENLSPFIIRSSYRGNERSNGRIQFLCPHGVERENKSKGERPLQHVLFTNCPALINVNQDRHTDTWTVTKLIKGHEGHMIGPEIYGTYQKVRKMSAKDIKSVNEMDGVGASRRRVAEAISENTGQFVQSYPMHIS